MDTEILTPQSITNTHAHPHLDNPPQHDFRHHTTRSGHIQQDYRHPTKKGYKSSPKTKTKNPTARNHRKEVFYTNYLPPKINKHTNRRGHESHNSLNQSTNHPTKTTPPKQSNHVDHKQAPPAQITIVKGEEVTRMDKLRGNMSHIPTNQ